MIGVGTVAVGLRMALRKCLPIGHCRVACPHSFTCLGSSRSRGDGPPLGAPGGGEGRRARRFIDLTGDECYRGLGFPKTRSPPHGPAPVAHRQRTGAAPPRVPQWRSLSGASWLRLAAGRRLEVPEGSAIRIRRLNEAAPLAPSRSGLITTVTVSPGLNDTGLHPYRYMVSGEFISTLHSAAAIGEGTSTWR